MTDLNFYLTIAALLAAAVAHLALNDRLKSNPYFKRTTTKPTPGPAPWDAAVAQLPPTKWKPPELPDFSVPFIPNLSSLISSAQPYQGKSSLGTVYVIQDTATGLYKIGRTTNMERRMRELGVGKTARLVNYRQVANADQVESMAHRRYKSHRLPQTEYFRLSTPPTV